MLAKCANPRCAASFRHLHEGKLLDANPIEKKPFYHFHPGTIALTAGSWSCNFGCPWCQNWDISKVAPPWRARIGNTIGAGRGES